MESEINLDRMRFNKTKTSKSSFNEIDSLDFPSDLKPIPMPNSSLLDSHPITDIETEIATILAQTSHNVKLNSSLGNYQNNQSALTTPNKTAHDSAYKAQT